MRRKYQSGEKDVSGRISKIGDAAVRTALYEAANIILDWPLKGTSLLKSWAMKFGPPGRQEKGEGGAGAQARRHLAPDVGRWNSLRGRACSLAQASRRIGGQKTIVFGRVATPAFPMRGPFVGTMDEARPFCSPWRQRPHAIRLAGLILI